VFLRKTLKNAISPSWGQAVYPLRWPSLTKDIQTEQLLCCSGMADTEHATSGSNEELKNLYDFVN